jgi:hypothetical protein
MDENASLSPGELDEELAGQTGVRGEAELRIAAYLNERGFVEVVMERIYSLPLHPRNALAWGLFCLANLALLVVLGANEPFLEGFFAPQAQLAQFFFLFLGITFLGALVGLVLSVDTSRLLPPHHRGRQLE